MAHFKLPLLRISACTFVLAGLGSFPHISHAGFEWKAAPGTAPSKAAATTSADMPAMPAMPQEQVDADKLSTMQNPAPQITAPVAPQPPDASSYPVLPPAMAAMVDKAPSKPAATPVAAPAPMTAPADMEAAHVPSSPDEGAAAVPAQDYATPPSASGQAGYAQAVGFGKDIPLALAMRQMVPPDYNFRFDSGVLQKTKISWTGGKPWNEALNNALQPAGYVAAIEGKTVHVSKPAVKTAEAATAPSPGSRLRPVPMAMPDMDADAVSKAAPDDKPAPRTSVRADAGSVISSPDKEETPPVETTSPAPPAHSSSSLSNNHASVVFKSSQEGEAAPAPQARRDVDRDAAVKEDVVSHPDETVATAPVAPEPAKAASPEPTTSSPSLPEAAYPAKPQHVREVYIRRNSSHEEVEDRVPATAVVSAPMAHGADPVPDDQPKRSFWSRMNPAHWSGDHTAQAEPADAEPRMAGGAETSAAAPAKTTVEPPSAMPDRPAAEAPPPPAVETEHLDSPADAPAKTTAFNPMDMRSWQAGKGDSLRSVLQKWSDTANVQLYWVPSQDYKLTQEIKLEGSYTDAVSSVLASYGDKGPRPVGRLHPNMPDGPAVLIIEPSSS